jgi:hypothetical protein
MRQDIDQQLAAKLCLASFEWAEWLLRNDLITGYNAGNWPCGTQRSAQPFLFHAPTACGFAKQK